MVGAKVGTARRLLERILNGVGHVPPDLAPLSTTRTLPTHDAA